jgi:hypothetical protein
MNRFEAIFFVWVENKEKGRYLSRVGSVIVDDEGTNDDFPIIAKAFRHAPESCRYADRVALHKVNKNDETENSPV